MLLALNAFRVVSSGPPPAASRTPIGLLLVWTRPIDAGTVEPPVEPPASNYAGGGVRRIRKFGPRKRKRDELLDAIAVTPPEVAAAPPLPEAPPAPGLMANMPMPARTVLRSPPDEDEDEIALLLELIS